MTSYFPDAPVHELCIVLQQLVIMSSKAGRAGDIVKSQNYVNIKVHSKGNNKIYYNSKLYIGLKLKQKVVALCLKRHSDIHLQKNNLLF